ncbi:hypothetical protein, conserved [Babesia ovata]|uniref:Uncharacterized protein n=1 Tax=Babesia ovata TaxID=189622 RepID=A0A2H6K9V3_9APIC|nr:uncharacterized protein BOVATA_012220 [Babesia ovata]GBE59729.1 hypothetical protein, conserved [Babesia ovata]
MIRHPKKLTDCPENLRESIDWLIQVKHGNGGDGKGLEELAKALKKLIGDAINNATESLEKRKKELECPKKYKGNESNCQYIGRLIKQAEESKNSGQPENPNKKLYEGYMKDCKVNYHNDSYYDDSTKKALKDIEKRQKTLKELKEKLEKFIGTKDGENPATKILENLCDGLQTFLGYNAISKGYDGSGIVYSDLDRLCDGVMSFLHGVLSGVKDDDNVITYNNYIKSSNNNDDLHTVLQHLHSSIGQGRSVFGPQVTAVSAWLGRYEGELGRKTREVTSQLASLKDSTIEGQKSKIRSTDKLPAQLTAWTQAVDAIDTAVKGIEREQLGALDLTLKERIEREMKPIKIVVDQLKKSAENKDLQELNNAAGEELEKLRGSVENKVTGRIITLRNALQDNFRDEIQEPIKQVKEKLDIKVEELTNWIKAAEDAVSKAKQQCDEIVKKLQGKAVSNEEREAITRAAQALKQRADDLRAKAYKAKGELTTQVKSALAQVIVMDRAVKYSLVQVKERLQSVIGQYVKDYVEEVQKKVKAIKGETGKEGLSGIRRKVMEYAARFKTDGTGDGSFGDIVQGWLEQILHSRPVIERVGEFATGRKLADTAEIFTYGERGITGLASNIVGELKSEIQEAIKAFEQHIEGLGTVTESEIEKHVDAVQQACNKFAQEVDQRMNTGSTSNIEGVINSAVRTSSTKKTFLLESITKLILTVLSTSARQVSTELYSFTDDDDGDYNLGKNVNAALKVATELDGAFTEAIKTLDPDEYSGATTFIPGSGQVELDANIQKTISEALEKQIGKEDSFGVQEKFALSHHFITYKKLVDASNLTGGQLIGDSTEGTFPPVIKKIEKEVNENAEHLENVEDGGDGKDPIKFNKETFTTMLESVKSCLEQFTQAVEKLVKDSPEKNSVHAYLEDLTNMLSEGADYKLNSALDTSHTVQGLQKIKDELNKIITNGSNTDSTTVEGIIKKAVEFQVTINNEADKAFKDIKQHLQQQVESATTIVTKKAQELYANRKQKELDALKKIVETQKTEIQKIIKHDTENGLKGLINSMKKHETWLTDIKTHLDSTTPNLGPIKDNGTKLQESTKALKEYLNALLKYIRGQVRTAEQPTEQSRHVSEFQDKLDNLLSHIQHKKHFDHIFRKYLDDLNESLNALSPSNFHGFHNPLLLDALSAGMKKFTEQLSRAYVNRYSGKIPTEKWVMQEQKLIDGTSKNVTVLSTEGRNCAKVCLTILERVSYDLRILRGACQSGKNANSKQIRLHDPDRKNQKVKNDLGHWFSDRGFSVSEFDKQDGELRNNSQCIGNYIRNNLLLKKHISDLKKEPYYLVKDEDADKEKKDQHGVVKTLVTYFRTYYSVCHLEHIPSAKAPSNIYQMLHWMLGLYYNPMRDPLYTFTKELFEKPKHLKDRKYSEIEEKDLSLDATTKITPNTLKDTLREVCLYSEDVLIALQGHGHAEGRYACDFYTNADKLLYPTSGGACFDMLVDISFRVYNQLRFVYKQCNNGPKSGGWNDCWYGQGVAGSNWQCNTDQCPNQLGNQPCNQKCDQTGDKHPKCGVKSPLQSYLEDGLPGFLPHTFTSPGCKLTCTVSNHFGKRCLTPMGFADIGIAASHTKNGTYLKEALFHLCDRPDSHLRNLCNMVNCLLPSAPKTLGDVFAFYHKFLENWSKNGEHKKQAFDDAVNKAYFKALYTKLDPSTILNSSTHETNGNNNHETGDLFTLINCNPSKTGTVPCAQYLQSLTSDIRRTFSDKRSGIYLSWIVYTTETFYDLLKKLYDECCKKCDTEGSRCYDKCCTENCEVSDIYSQSEKQAAIQDAKHNKTCNSIVKCQNMHPTLYTYGFTFGSPHELSGSYDQKTRRTCRDFCEALKKVIGEGCVLVKLIEDIDEFIWAIREKFSYLLLALWSLSLLYLLHITVVRLDVLRIRSHLRSPSSHRIAAQSLLAAARVKALANIKYFST